MTKPLLLLWTDGAGPYAAAIEAAGLDSRLRVETVARAATPTDEQLAEAEALLSWGPPPGMLSRMPKLRFVQALTAGVEHWLSRPDLPPTLALSCARGTHRVQMPENAEFWPDCPHEKRERDPEPAGRHRQQGKGRRSAVRRGVRHDAIGTFQGKRESR